MLFWNIVTDYTKVNIQSEIVYKIIKILLDP